MPPRPGTRRKSGKQPLTLCGSSRKKWGLRRDPWQEWLGGIEDLLGVFLSWETFWIPLMEKRSRYQRAKNPFLRRCRFQKVCCETETWKLEMYATPDGKELLLLPGEGTSPENILIGSTAFVTPGTMMTIAKPEVLDRFSCQDGTAAARHLARHSLPIALAARIQRHEEQEKPQQAVASAEARVSEQGSIELAHSGGAADRHMARQSVAGAVEVVLRWHELLPRSFALGAEPQTTGGAHQALRAWQGSAASTRGETKTTILCDEKD